MYFTVLHYYIYQPLSNIQVNVTVIFIMACVASFHCLGICIHIYYLYTERIIMWQKHHAVHSAFHSHFIFSLTCSWMKPPCL